MIISSHGFHHNRIVRFGECDPAGVTYYPEYFNWFHQAMEACFESNLGVSYATVIQDVGFPAVHTSASFHNPLSVGEHITIVVSVKKMGRSSIHWKFEIVNSQNVLCTVGEVKTVCIPVSKGRFDFESIPIPDELRPGLHKLIEDR